MGEILAGEKSRQKMRDSGKCTLTSYNGNQIFKTNSLNKEDIFDPELGCCIA